MTSIRLFLAGKRLSIVVLFLMAASCAPNESCFTDNTSIVQVKFLVTLFAGTDSVSFQDDIVIINTVRALGTDSVFVTGDTLSAISVPINTSASSTIFVFDSDQGLDTMELRYQRFQRFISEECGPEQIIDSLSLGRVSFDSVAVTSTLLNRVITNNVEIYR